MIIDLTLTVNVEIIDNSKNTDENLKIIIYFVYSHRYTKASPNPSTVHGRQLSTVHGRLHSTVQGRLPSTVQSTGTG